MRAGELLARAARAVRAIGLTALPISLARTEHGQTNQRLTMRAHGYNKKKNALDKKEWREPCMLDGAAEVRAVVSCFAGHSVCSFKHPEVRDSRRSGCTRRTKQCGFYRFRPAGIGILPEYIPNRTPDS
jgi:hypothetical protein